MFRSFLIIGIALCFISQWYLLAVLLFGISLFRYSGFELVVLAMLLDGYYNAFASWPLLTIATFLAWSLLIVLRQRLLLYTQSDETFS